MSVLVYVTSYNGKIHKNAFEAVTYGQQIAQSLNAEVTAVVCGEATAPEELGLYGAKQVLHANNAELNDFNPQLVCQVLKEAVAQTQAKVIVFSHDFNGKSIAPRLAAALDAGLVTGAIALPDLSNGFIVKKAVFSGKAFAGIEIKSEVKIIALLPNSIEVSKGENTATVSNLAVDLSRINSRLTVKEVKKESTTLSLSEAEIVVSAGRGLKGPENWGMIEDLAKELNAATACSRPVADIGWRPHHEHVGQTGVAIRPNLYFAIGISGAIQHLAGVNGSKTIVVINIDPEAPFFKAADYGIVGDAFEVIPKLIEAVKGFKASNN
jgi:electron transfer flavoprotein alpha subunit